MPLRILLLTATLAFPIACPAARVTSTSFEIAGLEGPAEILVDTWGIAHIYASTHYDAFFVQGFNAARDRLWQIDLWRRRGLGKLAAVFGPDFVEQDRAARLFLYRGSMYSEWLAYGPDAKQIAERFVAGINAYVDLTRKRPELLPPEFALLDYRPSRWSAEDVVRIRSHGLWRNVASEVARARVACAAGLEYDRVRRPLEPVWTTKIPEGLDPCEIPEDVLATYRLAKAGVSFERDAEAGLRAFPVMVDPESEASLGSNNWAIAPQRTRTGRPILANDPHRTHQVPSLRYATHLVAPGLDVIGAGEPALPGVSIGHNQRIAFGLTVFAVDQEDLYVYELDAYHPARYHYGGEIERFRRVRERIEVRGTEAEEVELWFSRHGPVVHHDGETGRAFAVRAAWLEPGMAPYFGSLAYIRAQNWNEFLAAMNRWGAPGENHVYADVDGNIGLKPAGMTPRRRNFDGLLPVPGDGRYEWDDFLPMDQLPVEFNPRRGWVATANSMTLPKDYPIDARRLGFEWTAPWRYLRIKEVLDGARKHTIEDSDALQRDYVSVYARRIIARLRSLKIEGDGARPALAMLRSWNAELSPGSAPAALWSIWLRDHFVPAVTKATLPATLHDQIPSTDSRWTLGWLESDEAEVPSLVGSTLEAAWAEAIQRMGEDSQEWAWGDIHPIAFAHPLLEAAAPPLREQMTLPTLPRGGSGTTTNNTSYRSNFQVRSGASWRMVLDVGRWDRSTMTNAPGQSGDPRSPFYANLLEGWATDQSFPLLYSRRAVQRNLALRIELTPAGG